jgi:hypothetical protein
VRNLEGRFLLRVAAALAIALWSGLVGALAGLGCHFVNPARYRSTGRVVVSADDGNPRDPVDRAVSLAATAKNPTTLSTAILVADLYHGQRDRSPLADLADKLPFTANITQLNSGRAAMVDVAMTYTDRDKVQRALDSVIRHMMSAEGPGRARLGAPRCSPASLRACSCTPSMPSSVSPPPAAYRRYPLCAELASANGAGR